jgi:hypothetical protein
MTNYLVTLEAAWLVKNVETVEDAMRIAISEIGKKLNPDLNFVEIEVGTTRCPACGESFDSVFLAADTALVGILFEMKVYEAKSEEHGARIAKATIGKALKDASLNVIDIEEIGSSKSSSKESSKSSKKASKSEMW